MTEKDASAKPDRRQFLKLLGGALGGLTLASCDSGGNSNVSGGGGGIVSTADPGATPIPNGYAFHRVFTLGSDQHGLDQVIELTPGLMINDNGEIVFYADNSSGGMGLYRLIMDFNVDPPNVIAAEKIVETRDVLNDGRRVDAIGVSDTNAFGNVAVVIGTNAPDITSATEANLPGIYLQTPGSALNPLFSFRAALPGGAQLGGAVGDLALNDNNDLLLVSHFTLDNADIQNEQGLFFFQGPGDRDLREYGAKNRGYDPAVE